MSVVRKAETGILLIILFVLQLSGAYAQVTNNNIHNRSELKLNESAFHSTTANSTVEWNCINKSLVAKCLIYHNDQWFHFTPKISGTLYLNISSQQCRDLRGVQLVVIEGNPCEIKTYKILRCIPKIYQDDVFVQLDSLKANMQYLVNIDGYLGDFCRFDIALSDKPLGLPETSISKKALELKSESTVQTINLRWQATQTQLDEIDHFEVYRSKSGEVKSTLLTQIDTRSNALGIHNDRYFYTDTIYADGDYQYKIIAVNKMNEGRVLLDEVKVKFYPERDYIVKVPLNFSKRGQLQIIIMDAEKNATISSFVREYLQPEELPIDLRRFVKSGSKRFWLSIRNPQTREGKLFAYQINQFGLLEAVEK